MNKLALVLLLVVLCVAMPILQGSLSSFPSQFDGLEAVAKRNEPVVRVSRACARDRFGRAFCTGPTCRVDAFGRRICVG